MKPVAPTMIFSTRIILGCAVSVSVLISFAGSGAETRSKDRFAPLPENHELASIWNDPDFTRRLIGSYGFNSATEPIMRPEDQQVYREKVLPMLTNGVPEKSIPLLQALVKPTGTAVFDFTLGNLY